MQRVFVYGTLKKGFAIHDRIFAGCNIKITPAWTYDELYDLGYFPALLERSGNPDLSGTDGNNKVYGELIEFDDIEILRKIDRLEGYRNKDNSFNFYERREIQVFTEKDEFTAWAYYLSDETIAEVGGILIKSGIWSE